MKTFTVYPEGVERLKASGLLRKITRKRSDARYDDYIDSRHVREMLTSMTERGYFKSDKTNNYMDRMKKAFQSEGESDWKLEYPEGVKLIPSGLEDFPIIGGELATEILTPDEFWSPEKFGFDTHSAFVGTIGALIHSRTPSVWEGPSWESESPRTKRRAKTILSGTFHGDFRIIREDRTICPTTDPTGNEVPFRPTEEVYVSAYHSIEPYILVALLKYAEQTNVAPSVLKDPVALVNEFRAKGQQVGNFADFGDAMRDVRSAFLRAFNPIPSIDNQGDNPYVIPTQNHNLVYLLALNADNDLCVVESWREEGKPPKNKTIMEFSPNELDNFIRGLFTQASMGLGRSSVSNLASVLEYRYSPQYEEDKSETERLVRRNRKK